MVEGIQELPKGPVSWGGTDKHTDKQTNKQTDRHINTMTRPGLSSDNFNSKIISDKDFYLYFSTLI